MHCKSRLRLTNPVAQRKRPEKYTHERSYPLKPVFNIVKGSVFTQTMYSSTFWGKVTWHLGGFIGTFGFPHNIFLLLSLLSHVFMDQTHRWLQPLSRSSALPCGVTHPPTLFFTARVSLSLFSKAASKTRIHIRSIFIVYFICYSYSTDLMSRKC